MVSFLRQWVKVLTLQWASLTASRQGLRDACWLPVWDGSLASHVISPLTLQCGRSHYQLAWVRVPTCSLTFPETTWQATGVPLYPGKSGSLGSSLGLDWCGCGWSHSFPWYLAGIEWLFSNFSVWLFSKFSVLLGYRFPSSLIRKSRVFFGEGRGGCWWLFVGLFFACVLEFPACWLLRLGHSKQRENPCNSAASRCSLGFEVPSVSAFFSLPFIFLCLR